MKSGKIRLQEQVLGDGYGKIFDFTGILHQESMARLQQLDLKKGCL